MERPLKECFQKVFVSILQKGNLAGNREHGLKVALQEKTFFIKKCFVY